MLATLAGRAYAQGDIEPRAPAPPTIAAIQASGAADSASAPAPMPAGPTRAAATVGARPVADAAIPATGAPVPVFQGSNRGRGNALALMIVGGAGLLVGAVIGDDAGTIIMVGSAVIGLYGLYQFLK
jgi:hypothetical protein